MTQSELEFTRYYQELTSLYRRDVTQGIKLGKYKKHAQSMMKKDPVAANTLLGLLACLEHDMASMHEYHKKAIDLCESTFSLMYYAASLEKSCLWNESVRYALLALDYQQDNFQLLSAIIEIAPLTGRFSLLKRLLPQWEEANNCVPHHFHGHCETIGEILSANGFLEKDLKAVLTVIGDALSETDVILKKFRYDIVTGRHDTSFVHFRLAISDQFAAAYYEDLIGAKLDAARFHPRIYDAFSFSVENSTVYELYDYMEKELNASADSICIPDPDQMKLVEELVAGVEISSW